MSAIIPFKKIIPTLLILLLFAGLAGCGVADEFLAPETSPETDLEEEVQPPPGNELPGGSMAIANDPLPTRVMPSSSFTLGSSLPLKPVKFRNLGTLGYTVAPWSYIPPSDALPSIPPLVSTVAFPGGSASSSALSLPLGTYTWCYSWELGDTNEDGMMDYAHAFDTRPVVLDENDTDDVDLAETVDLTAPAPIGAAYGLCGLEITPFVVEHKHADTILGPLVNMGHDTDSVTLKGPITVAYYYIHAEQEIFAGVPREMTVPELVVIPAGETYTFELVDGREDHPGDWNMYIWLLSIDE
jgi:hypothetical protein